jgi:hypothetical protein
MNERIRELMAEADRKCSETRGIYDEILAQLIVKECLSIVEPTQHHQAFAPSYLGDVEGLELLENKVTQIKKHFGV